MSASARENLFFLPLKNGPLRPWSPRLSATPDREGALSGNSQFVGDEANRSLRVLLDLEHFHPHYWPLVLYGPSGSGKTALAEALVERLASLTTQDSDSPRSLLLAASDFARGLTESIQTKSVDSFIERLLSYQAIGFDNLDVLQHYPTAQAEMVSILDRLGELKIPILVTLPNSPELLPLTDPLISRLSTGLVLPVNYPGENARVHLIDRAARDHGCPCDRDFATRLARSYPLAWPQLNRLVLENKRRMTYSPALASQPAQHLSKVDSLESSELSSQQKLTLAVKVVAEYFQLDPDVVNSSSRKQTTVLARSLAIFLARDLFQLNYSCIGHFFGGRDHTTILHACRKIQTQLTRDDELNQCVTSLRGKLMEWLSMTPACDRLGE